MPRVCAHALRVHVAPLISARGHRYGASVRDRLPHGMLQRFAAAGIELWGASAYKGASDPGAVWVPVAHHVTNHEAWLEVAREASATAGIGMEVRGPGRGCGGRGGSPDHRIAR